MTYEYRCPRCESKRIKVGYPNYECLACGYTEPLSDFPISWDVHRSLSINLQGYDPGPCEPPEHNLGKEREESNPRYQDYNGKASL